MAQEITGELKTLLQNAAFASSPDRAFLRITGADATRWLNGMVTNSIQGLTPGKGSYNFLLNAQGRIQGDCTIYRVPLSTEPTYLLETDTFQIETIHQLLDRFIIMDDVEIAAGFQTGGEAQVDAPASVVLIGPQSFQVLAKLVSTGPDLEAVEAMTPGSALVATLDAHEILLLSPPGSGVPSVTVWSSRPAAIDALVRALEEVGIPQVPQETLEALRILEGRPRYGTDIRNTDAAKDLPQETNQIQALHFAKGCYVGQEIVERIRSRGQVHRLFTLFRLDGAPPAVFPVSLEVNGKPAGELTSSAAVGTTGGSAQIALGYARREYLEQNAAYAYPGGTAFRRVPGQLT